MLGGIDAKGGPRGELKTVTGIRDMEDVAVVMYILCSLIARPSSFTARRSAARMFAALLLSSGITAGTTWCTLWLAMPVSASP